MPLLVLCGLPLFFITGFGLTGSAFFGAVSGLGHTAFFCALTLSLLPLIQQHWPDRWRRAPYYWLILSLAGLILSLLIETIQHWVGRQFAWLDIGFNLFGVWVILLWWPDSRPRGLVRWPVQTLVVVVLLAASWQAAQTYQDRSRLQQQQPLVFDQSQSRAISYWEGAVGWAPEWPGPEIARPDPALPLVQLKFSTDRFSSAMLTQLPHDWSGYDQLSFNLYNPEASALDVRLRINDHAHEIGNQEYEDRFNTGLSVEPGWNRFDIALAEVRSAPAQREMDMQTIRRVGLFTTQLTKPALLYLNDLRLH